MRAWALVPEDIHWIPAQTAARVDKIVIRPGHLVQPDTIILEMSNPETQRDLLDAQYQLKAAEADCANLRVQIDSELNDPEGQRGRRAERLRASPPAARCGRKLQKEGIGAEVIAKLSKVKEDQLAIRLKLETERTRSPSIPPELACWHSNRAWSNKGGFTGCA